MIEVARLIFEKEGHKIVYLVNRSWEQAIEQTRDGKYTAIADAYKSDAPDFIYPKKVQVISGNRAIYQNAKKLLYDTLNVIVEDERILDYYFTLKAKVTPVKIAGHTPVENIYIAFLPHNKNSKKYAEILSRGMQRIQKSGELEVVLKKYGMYNWK